MNQEIKNIGFKCVGKLNIVDDTLKPDIDKDYNNILYAISSNREILYIGKTTESLKGRLRSHLKSFHNDLMNFAKINVVDIFVLDFNFSFYLNDIKLNIADALELPLIYKYRPKLNTIGNTKFKRLIDDAVKKILVNELNISNENHSPSKENSIHIQLLKDKSLLVNCSE